MVKINHLRKLNPVKVSLYTAKDMGAFGQMSRYMYMYAQFTDTNF